MTPPTKRTRCRGAGGPRQRTGLFLLACLMLWGQACTPSYDLVLVGGRVMDPESGLDGVRNLGIRGQTIAAISEEPLDGKELLDAGGLVVAPGFIDLHAHGQDAENSRAQVKDGVTTALELEIGVGNIRAFYDLRQGKALNHYGASIGHAPLRMDLMDDPGELLPTGPAGHRQASDAEIEELVEGVEAGLKEGAVGVGMGLQYTPAASRWEVLEIFRVAARHGATVFVHIRHFGDVEPTSGTAALEEVVAASAITGASLHVVHVNSSGGRAAPQLLEMIAGARNQGLDVTTECYPYTAGLTRLESALFDGNWRESLGIDFADLQWVETGERLNAETFERYRQTGGMVILHMNPQEVVDAVVVHPLTLIASDGRLADGKGHPRTAGTFSRILGRYVREKASLSLMEALKKMTLLPAQRLEPRIPVMKNKGRIRQGADADLTLFDPQQILDRSTYQDPALPPDGVRHVLVNGTWVLKDGEIVPEVYPGQAIRASGGASSSEAP